MSGLLTLLILALAAAALTAIASGIVVLRRAGRLALRGGLAGAGLAVVAAATAVLGIAAVQPAPAPARESVAAIDTAVGAPVDVQLPTLALDE
ncbi:MAG: hypothetical protein QM675_07750 [Protaetiibacter sp.]